MQKVLITGGSGLIGKRLSELLSSKGFVVEHLSRSRTGKEPYKTWLWKPDKNWIEEASIENTYAIFHLAGANIGSTPFTEEGKNLLLSSRVNTANLLYNTAVKIDHFPEKFISASAIGYYGMKTSDQILYENDKPGNDFISKLVVDWEASADQFSARSKVVKVRISLVLDKDQGALSKIALPVKYGLGASLGKGEQWMPWIHLEDLCNIFIYTMVNKHITGVFNGVAPEHLTHKSFLKKLASKLGKSLWLPNIPSKIIQLFLGEKADLILKGSKISSEKILNAGYKFQYPTLSEAFNEIYS